MQKNPKIAFIGAGNMGGAIVRGLLEKGVVNAKDLTVCLKTDSRRLAFTDMCVRVADSIPDAIEGASYIFICVKPKDVAAVVSAVCNSDKLLESATLVSIAASVSTSLICGYCNRDLPVIRTMPGMPLLIGEGTVAISRNQFVTDRAFQFVCRLFSSIALVSVIDEVNMNPIISVNGSSPAYVFYMIKAMLDGAEEQGIDSKHALPLILQTVIGSAKMLENSDLSIEENISRICSPKGTTLEAMKVLEESDFHDAIKRAMSACTRRADEITEELQT